jgi:hypothetical protein
MLKAAPQFTQNLPLPAGLPHSGHIVCLLSIFPVNTWVTSALALISLAFFLALAEATSTASLGAHLVHKPSCSFQSFSQTHSVHFGQR